VRWSDEPADQQGAHREYHCDVFHRLPSPLALFNGGV
jgi:hypothetical protein